MCVITIKRADQTKFGWEYLDEMRIMGHKDGIGIMRVVDDRVHIHKILSPTKKELEDVFAQECKGYDVAIHMRRQSVGPVNYENVHPFWVLNKDWGDEIDLAMMHNGTIPGVQIDSSRADSYNVAAHILRPLFQKRPDLIDCEEYWWSLAGFINNSKLVFLDSNNNFTTINSALGQWHKGTGVWASTTSDINPKTGAGYKPATTQHFPKTNPAPPPPEKNAKVVDGKSAEDSNKIVPFAQTSAAGFVKESDQLKHFQYWDDGKIEEHMIDEFGIVRGAPVFLAYMHTDQKIALASADDKFFDLMQDFEAEALSSAATGTSGA